MTPPNDLPRFTVNHCPIGVNGESAEGDGVHRADGVAQGRNANDALHWHLAMVCIVQGIMLHGVTTQTIEDFDG